MYPKGKPNLETGKEMMIGAYWCPEPSSYAYKLLHDCGYTHLLVNPTPHNKVENDDFAVKTLKLAKENDIKIVYHCNNHSYKVLEKHREIINKEKTCTGIFVWDEPPIDKMEMLANEYKEFVKDYPDMPYYVNTWPLYSCKEQRGIQSYYRYLNEYAEKIVRNLEPKHRTFFCDIYPMLRDYGIYEKWLFNLEYVKDLAERENADLYTFFIAQSFSDRRQHTKACEYIFQTYVNLAYGVKGLLYCPYQTPFAGDDPNNPTKDPGVINLDGTPSPIYPLAKANNEEIKRIDGVYLGFEWRGVFSRIGVMNRSGKNANFTHCNNFIWKFGLLEEITSSQDSLIGCFENKEGYDGYIVVNFTEPLFNMKNRICMNIREANKAIVYLKGEPKEFDIIDGKLEFSLFGGEGAFVVPYIR